MARAKTKAKAKKPPKQAKPKPKLKKATVKKKPAKARKPKTATTLAGGLRAWIAKGGPIDEFVTNVHDVAIDSADDVAAICEALDTLREKPRRGGRSFTTPLHRLTGFFQQTGSRDIAVAFARDGLPRLRTWVQDALDGKDVSHDDVLFILKILCGYRVESDVELIAACVRKPIAPDDFMWSVVFRFDETHPGAKRIIELLRDPLPPGFAGVTFLDNANQLAIAKAIETHPFDSAAGRERLAGYLRDPNAENFSYAHSATVALPYLSDRGDLLDVAAQHPDPNVRMEAAWAAAKVGDRAGLDRLAELAADPRHASVAQRYLEELGAADRIPASARDDGFRAVAAMAEWLAHPNELGHPPESIELLDRRVLFWPPTNDRRGVALVRYEDEGSAGIGMVGSITFVLFGEATADLSPEDVYGLHCCWELEMNGDKRAPKKRTAKAGRALLAKENSGFQ